MVDLTKSQISTIENFVSHPGGLGYVLDFSNKTFAEWFEENWGVDIDDRRYNARGNSKRHRLIAFCLREDADLVSNVLVSILRRSEKIRYGSNSIPNELRQQFIELVRNISAHASSDGKKQKIESQSLPQSRFVSKQFVSKRIKENATPLMLSAISLLEQIAAYREQIRYNNELGAESPNFRDELIEFLDRLAVEIEHLVHLIPKQNIPLSENKKDEATAWANRFVFTAIPEWKNYISPENLGRVSAPAGIILGCGAIGALLTGSNPLGFGAGSLVGKWITGEIKSGAAADRLAEQIEADTKDS